MTDPAVTLLIILIIGIAAGTLFDRFAGAGWLARQFTGPRGYVTSSLVGIAGAFVGFHVAVLIGLAGIAAFIVSVVGAAAVLFAWRALR